MSGILFDDPDLRFSKRLRLFVSMIPSFALLLFRWLTKVDRSSRSHSRQFEVEFPATAQTAYQLTKRTLWGSPIADRASIDALRPHNNWVNIEDQHEISFIWEKLAAFARRVPIQGRTVAWRLSPEPPKLPPAKKSLWQRITAFFSETGRLRANQSSHHATARSQARPARKPEAIEVTTPRLYVGNLSFDATESDLFELFNGVGQVQNAEVVTYKHNQRSKGFAFVQMLTVEEAKRAVKELHDKEFLGRKLVVSGAKSSDHHAPRN